MKAIRRGPNSIILVAIMLLAISVNAEYKLMDLGTLGGNASSAAAINDRGEIVGWSAGSDGMLHAFCYRKGLLRSLNGNPCQATAINDAGRIVGKSLTPRTNIIVFPFPTNPIFPPTNAIFPPTNIIIVPPFSTNPTVIWPTNPIVIVPINPILPTNPAVFPPTNIIIVPPFPTNPIVIWPTNPIVILPVNPILPTNPIVIPPTNIVIVPPFPTNPIVIWPTNIVILPITNSSPLFAGAAAREVAVTASRQILSDVLTTNGITITNIAYLVQPALFRHGALINLFLGTNSGVATGINNRGEIVGGITLNSVSTHAFIYRKGFTMDLGTLGGSFSEAAGINNRGDVVGSSSVPAPNEGIFPGYPSHPFLYRHGRMRDLGTLGGSTGEATAINDLGEIVGFSATVSNAELHAFLYRNGKMTDLGALESAGGTFPGFGPQSYSSASAINNWGQIVGTSASTNGDHAFLYSNGTMTDLNSLVTLTYFGGPPGFIMLTYARGINDFGDIVGDGLYWDGTSTSTRAFLMEWRPDRRSHAARWPHADRSERYSR